MYVYKILDIHFGEFLFIFFKHYKSVLHKVRTNVYCDISYDLITSAHVITVVMQNYTNTIYFYITSSVKYINASLKL